MQASNFIDVPLAGHISGAFSHHLDHAAASWISAQQHKNREHHML
jgi:hypothetical protein